MKERVTLTMGRDVVAQAKRLAHQRGTSLSGLVENSLRVSLQDQPAAAGSFVDRWAGKFSAREGPADDLRLRALKAKHRLA